MVAADQDSANGVRNAARDEHSAAAATHTPDSPAPLVTSCISHRAKAKAARRPRPAFRPITHFEVLPADVRVCRDYGPQSQPAHLVNAPRGVVQMFSPSSAARLTKAARNAMPALVTQFCLTYHSGTPDGRSCKLHLDTWLKALRRLVPGVGYLWILEFQSRGTPHFHVWLTCPFSEELWKHLGEAWNRIAEPSSTEHLWWHSKARVDPRTGREQRSCIPWEMKTAGYLRKYMSKEAQKSVPADFVGVGRFWGSSRGMVPAPMIVEVTELGAPLEDVTRTICKFQEAARRRASTRSRKAAELKGKNYRAFVHHKTPRGTDQSGWLNNASSAFLGLLSHYHDQNSKSASTPEISSPETLD